MHDYAGVIHIHSRYSDGSRSIEAIAREAERAGADFAIITDHDTLAGLRDGKEGWHGKTLVVVGMEVTPPGGNHYLAVGVSEEVSRELPPVEIVREVAVQGGLGFIAHPRYEGPPRYRLAPYPWTAWDVQGYDGIEIWTYAVDWITDINSLWQLLDALFWPDRYVQGPFPQTMQRWDQVAAAAWARGDKVVGIGAVDAHGFLYSYWRMFLTVRTHVLTREPFSGHLAPDKSRLLAALREGHAYVAYDVLQRATGFRFLADNGDQQAIMGDSLRVGRGVRLAASAPAECELTLLREGEPVAHGTGTSLEHVTARPGLYRVEARLRRSGRVRPWVFTNPVFLRA